MSNCMTMSLRSTQTVLFAPIEMLDSWTHKQHPEMIARPGPRYSLLESLPSKTCSGVTASAQAGHLMEKPLDAQLQVPCNRRTSVTSTAPPQRPPCPWLSPPHCVSHIRCGQHILLHCFNLLLHLSILRVWLSDFVLRVCESGTETTLKDSFGLSSLM